MLKIAPSQSLQNLSITVIVTMTPSFPAQFSYNKGDILEVLVPIFKTPARMSPFRPVKGQEICYTSRNRI